jgi:hypothetical protein
MKVFLIVAIIILAILLSYLLFSICKDIIELFSIIKKFNKEGGIKNVIKKN